jgi:opacity protein-like surface antigen
MSNENIKRLAIAAVLTLAGTTTYAADFSVPIMPQPVEVSGWYLRGDIGFSNQKVGSLFNSNYSNFTSVTNIDKGFDAAPLFGLGIGYAFNHWLRFDVTGEYRGAANFKGLDIGTLPACNTGPGPCFADDRYTASKSEWTFLFNGYVDLGTWYNFTPFVGAGVGVSRNTISNFGDFTTCLDSSACLGPGPNGGGGSDAFAGTASTWNFAWALHAGLAYQLSRNVTLELAYRYIDLGNARSGDVIAFDGTNNINNPMEFHHLTSNDVKLGLRFNFGGDDFDRPRPVYVPPPPLNSKG